MNVAVFVRFKRGGDEILMQSVFDRSRHVGI